MKTRKFDKKLTLNKETVSNLNNGQMKLAYGGAPPTDVVYEKTVGGVAPPIVTCNTCGVCQPGIEDSACPSACFEICN